MQPFKFFKARQPHRVSRIPTEDSENEHDDEGKFLPFNEESPQEPHQRESPWLILACFISMISIAVFSGAGGYYLGKNAEQSVEPDTVFEDWGQSSTSSPSCVSGSLHDKYISGLLAPAGDIDSHLIWNGNFSRLKPSPQAYLEAWRGLFPLHNTVGGIVQHPDLAPNASAVAVFHQLHCLMNVQSTLYQAIAEPASQNWTVIPYHTEQCIDYLTQGILCNADTNLEPIDPSLYGKDTAIPRTCRDMKSVYDFVRRWQTQMTNEQLDAVFHAHRVREQSVYGPGSDSNSQ
ncbi:hypothetical protein N7490_009036 [Penicillium lividum]|nr:hypothetical protein N7490_009036 [Penicillium lividum]